MKRSTPSVSSRPLPRRSYRILIAGISFITCASSAQALVYNDDPNALLASSRGGSWQWDYCYDKSHSEPVPVDPRTLVQPGVNDGKAVHFNAHWVECHTDPDAVQELLTRKPAASCGRSLNAAQH